MRYILAAIFSIILSTASIAGMSKKDMNAQIDQTNFLVNKGCSGTLIDKDNGYILTANHCIDTQFEVIEREKIDKDGVVTKEKVRIARPGTVSQLLFKNTNEVQRTSYTFKIKSSDKELDLALIQVQTKLPNSSHVTIACNDIERLDVAYVVGNPYGKLYSSVTKGIVSSTQRNYSMIGVSDQGEHGLIQVSSGVIGGNSGGAVYNDNGEFVGVPVMASPTHEIIGLSVPLSDIKTFLKKDGLDNLWSRCAK